MKRAESISSLIVILLCSIYLYSAFSLPFGTLKTPGPGLLPVILGCIGLAMSLAWFVTAFRKGKKTDISSGDAGEKGEKAEKAGVQIGKLFWFLLAIILYIVTFKFVNPFVSALVIVIVLSKICDLEGWKKPLLLGVSFSVFIYIVFVMWFNVQF